MTTGFEMGKETLRQQASRMRGHGAEYDAAIARLRDRSGKWGDDGLFAAIEMAWGEARDSMVTAVPALGGAVTGVGDGLTVVPANVEAAEHASRLPETDPWP
ncbi:hypothetical protein [Nonomuraea glycinis]|uniref:hypothetical protein n=1 Tax=Nonomuraea glycinis TaxID=2047744 RepID=UPI002E13157B|nr:hypothetical protein OHA68_18750 [Nonomuraea glycinis]